jgi:uncharacterized protein
MDRTTLCIQGPPGCGKTYNASVAIAKLLQSGKKVGITSNSHKAVENLLEAIADVADRQSIKFSGAQIRPAGVGSASGKSALKRYVKFSSSSKLFNDEEFEGFQLIAGTAWLFSNPSAAGTVDYLFVDEAGQVSLAVMLRTAS